MPAVVVGAASMWSGVAAWGTAATMWTSIAAGAEIVGGAMAVFGAATKNEKLANTGMLLGGLGAVGSIAAESFAAKGLQATKAGTTAASEMATPADTLFTGGADVSGAAKAGSMASPDVASMMKETTARYENLTRDMMKSNLQAQVIGGIGQAAQGYMSEQTKRDMMEEERRRYEREYANRNNLVGLKLPQVAMPKLGLLGQQQVQQQPVQQQVIQQPTQQQLIQQQLGQQPVQIPQGA